VRSPRQGVRRTEPVRPYGTPHRAHAAATRTVPAEPVGVGRRRRAVARIVLSGFVMTFAAGLVATLALPSYAFDPHRASATVQVAGRETTKSGAQQLPRIAGDVATATITRDAFSATSKAELKRAALAKQYASYTGPTASDYVASFGKNPAHPAFGLSALYRTALGYQGVPYVFGGADPSGFDCSGFVMFVYAQYGVSLPHSVRQQDLLGTRIPESQAEPGDVVVFDGDAGNGYAAEHDGLYAGNGMILHAPYPGENVRVQPIWTTNVHFVRFGIK
jgi:cell wall-associated NlpC family hydrolase